MKETLKIALTGVMGSGKSSAAALLKEAGILVIDCDEINRQLLCRDHIGYQKVVAAFGDQVLASDQTLDAQALSDQIFCDPQKKQQLEAILHPLIQAEVLSQMDQCREPLIVVEVPLLFETHWEAMFDEIWVVCCQEATRLARLQEFRHISRTEAQRRLSHQMSQEDKCVRADVLLHNDGDIKDLKRQIEKQLERLLKGMISC